MGTHGISLSLSFPLDCGTGVRKELKMVRFSKFGKQWVVCSFRSRATHNFPSRITDKIAIVSESRGLGGGEHCCVHASLRLVAQSGRKTSFRTGPFDLVTSAHDGCVMTRNWDAVRPSGGVVAPLINGATKQRMSRN